jgi:hypothetical protein
MNYLERYLNGDHEQAWNDLLSLHSAVRRQPYADQAQAVATETMRRVRRNCERIVNRLQSAGYIFGIYPDGSGGYTSDEPLSSSSYQPQTDIARLEDQVGPVPLSLLAFWREVGAVDLVGMHPDWPSLLDPLVVYAPEAALVDLESWDDDEEDPSSEAFEAGLAPDNLHKDNISGGEPYSVRLPDPSADFLLRYEQHGLYFVPYLRLAILRWGGLPGLEQSHQPFPLLSDLIAGLEPF